ncbi:SGNH/GDSL hydrolase family protein [Massilia sp. YIM B02769]|uniref:SGNH/GDSL hydrolase family protein n=1 Tax=unclassified Massilia TaxID=2609279 RepID=UPI0025B6DA02|nr:MULTISPECIES: SGNH/GDSL hydrolase family protein [unclassified Massilia]MDN4057728.1 SGNH/GDSL hydrolase family protein [Massilia sp. YIM B02769]
MRQKNFALALLTAAALAACGGTGSSGGDQSHPITFSQQVTFGDSLSDVGTYNVGAVKVAGGGKFSINGSETSKDPALTGLNWTEVLAAELRLPAPCAAQTGLEGTNNDANPALDFNVPIVNNVNCFNYAQGGARVTNPIGPGNKVVKPEIGEMTVPVATQVQMHLAKTGGKFSGTELVTIMAGGNDVLMQLAAVSSAGTTAGQQAFPGLLISGLVATTPNPATALPLIQQAVVTNAANGQTAIINAAVGAAVGQGATLDAARAAAAKAGTDATAAGAKAAAEYAAANAQTLVAALGKAGAEKAAIVKDIVAKGAKYVVVNNLPDVANTPSGRAQPALQPLIDTMVNAFNTQLKAGLGESPAILYVDLYSISRDQMTNPKTKEIYGLSNVTTPACDLANPAVKETSLLCTTRTLVAGDTAHFMYADSIHPTPYEYWLIARYILKDMAVKGWL